MDVYMKGEWMIEEGRASGSDGWMRGQKGDRKDRGVGRDDNGWLNGGAWIGGRKWMWRKWDGRRR